MIKVNRKLLSSFFQKEVIFFPVHLRICLLFPPPSCLLCSQGTNTISKGIEFAISFQFSIIRELEREVLLFFLNMLLRRKWGGPGGRMSSLLNSQELKQSKWDQDVRHCFEKIKLFQTQQLSTQNYYSRAKVTDWQTLEASALLLALGLKAISSPAWAAAFHVHGERRGRGTGAGCGV